MKKGDWLDGCLTILGGLALIAVIIVITPVLYFVFGAFVGWLLANVIVFAGQWLIDGMALFGMHLAFAQLPLFCGTLGFLGAYFVKSSFTTKKG